MQNLNALYIKLKTKLHNDTETESDCIKIVDQAHEIHKRLETIHDIYGDDDTDFSEALQKDLQPHIDRFKELRIEAEAVAEETYQQNKDDCTYGTYEEQARSYF